MNQGKLVANIVVSFSTPEEAMKVSQSLEPDNKPLPKSLSLDTTLRENQFEIHITVDGVIETLLNTIDDFLQHINLSMDMQKITKE
ncbi:MAG: KEOPS complex subunit Pcc1 [Candidatus Ranarchaeia archaeon]|jgi:tRNA threonylcarbamoyladenosine modification (KEOPS) complex  Pcc1 subunit